VDRPPHDPRLPDRIRDAAARLQRLSRTIPDRPAAPRAYTVLSDPDDEPLPLTAVADERGTVWQRGTDWTWWPTFPRDGSPLTWSALVVTYGPLTVLAPAGTADHEVRQTDPVPAGDDVAAVLAQDMRDTNPDPQAWKDTAPLVPVYAWATGLVQRGWRPTMPTDGDLPPSRFRDVVLALDELKRAYSDKGPRPDVHDRLAARHRQEWPTLWRALDRLLRQIGARP
jgi:hypothetical protein